ncbi:Iron-sulphur-binding reductase [Bacillus thuringiensis serovar israelensis ATCC 35646]|nr:Iron-sulphur-binding reductase [Bacillus thuringiensis serovar israelensis ATCC 35646]
MKILKRKRAYKERGSIKMNSLLIINWLAAIAVIAYAGYLFVYLIRTRIAYIQLGKKIEFDRRFKERWDLLRSMFSVRKSC